MTRRLALLLLLALAPRPAAAAEDLAAFAFDQRPGAALPLDAPLRDEAGAPATLRGLGGLPAILVLGYFHCPNLCGVVRDDLFSALSRSGLRAGRDYRLLAVSIDPAEGAADAARAKADDLGRYPTPGGAGNWRFLTGGADALAAVADAVGFRSRYDRDVGQFLHPSGLVFLTGAGTVSGYLLGVGYEPSDLEAGIRRAAAGTLAPPASPVLLLCFHYDPSTGRYTLAIMKVVRLAGLLTVAAIAAGMVVAHRRNRAA